MNFALRGFSEVRKTPPPGSRVNMERGRAAAAKPRPLYTGMCYQSLALAVRQGLYFFPVVNCQTFDCASALPASSFTPVVMVAL